MNQRVKKVPMRTCVGCYTERPKKELIRIVRSPEGDISLDPGGKKSGRGAYICPDPECLKKARKQRRLEKSLEAEISPEIYGALEKSLAELEAGRE